MAVYRLKREKDGAAANTHCQHSGYAGETDASGETTDEEVCDTRGLMFRTLSNLGCQPTKNEDGTLSVSYQGENFQV